MAFSGTMFAARAKFAWRVRGRVVELGERTLVMGILNVTPDSFSDGGRFRDADHAVAAGVEMFADGADIVDVGGESTRPGSAFIPAEEEMARVLPVLRKLRRDAPDALISVDTTKAGVARAAVAEGADIVNDVSGMLWDENMAAACSKMDCGVVLMHTRGRPDVWKHLPALAPGAVLPLVRDALRERVEFAQRAGIARERIVVDPGFGFGKQGEENYALLAALGQLGQLNLPQAPMGFPVMAGVSRKAFLGATLEAWQRGRGGDVASRRWEEVGLKRPEEPVPAKARVQASAAAAAALVLAGAHIVRVHDVKATCESVAVADAILRAS